jgi:hypothetical protein
VRVKLPAALPAAALAVAVLLAGCATVPTQGPIRSGSQAGLAPDVTGIGVEAQGPRDNATPLNVVNGFLEAMADSRAFDVARKYMTPEAAAAWKPESQIQVYDQSSTKAVALLPGPPETPAVELNAPLISTINQRGSWAPATNNQPAKFVFKLVKVDNQWRVTTPPPGVFLGSFQLEPKLTPRYLYFFNPERNMLVPDQVYLPNNLPPGQTATQLVQELLKGPTDRLGNGVVSAAPPGTQVNVSVPVDLGVATVALSDTAAGLGEEERRQLAAQIAWTLRPISTRIRITVGGARLFPDDPSDIIQFASTGQYDPSIPGAQSKDLYGVRSPGGKIVHIVGLGDGQTIEARPVDGSQLYGLSAESFAVSLRGEFGAIVTRSNGDGVVAVARLDSTDKTDKIDTIPTDGKVLRPSFDNEDNLWILDRADRTKPRLRMRSKDGKLTEVSTGFGGDTPVTLRVAPDGVRVLMVMKSKNSSATYVQTGAITTNDAKQIVLGQFHRLELALTDITDASWNQPGILVAGKSAPGASRQPWQVDIDGSRLRLLTGASSLFEATKVASNPNIDTLPVVQDAQGRLHWQQKDSSWTGLDDGAGQDPRVDPVYPG